MLHCQGEMRVHWNQSLRRSKMSLWWDLDFPLSVLAHHPVNVQNLFRHFEEAMFEVIADLASVEGLKTVLR